MEDDLQILNARALLLEQEISDLENETRILRSELEEIYSRIDQKSGDLQSLLPD